jgi:coenzyme F420-reducing hydrogenase beta subunit
MDHMLSPKDIVDSGLCIGCGSCVAQAGLDAVKMQWDAYGQLKPQGPRRWMEHASKNFTRNCPFSPAAANEDFLAAELFPGPCEKDASLGRFQSAYVGHVTEKNFRMEGSSGGMVNWVAATLLRMGWIDGLAHVVASEDPQTEGRYFRYRISRTEAEIQAGAKSRYYPIELSEILQEIREVPGNYAVVGIPCFIKAVELLRREDPLFRERIPFTLGLFCGHMKSAKFIESFAWQMAVPVAEIQQVEFRCKDPDRPANWYKAQLTLRSGRVFSKDWWHLSDGDWGAGFFMNSACNFCDDVVAETADISFGDAWIEPYSSDGKGTNVVVIRSPLIESLVKLGIQKGSLQLDTVDNEFVRKTQEAGIRQRREGLGYRLSWKRFGVQPCKRVAPDSQNLDKRRKLIYRMRYEISAWSHRVFWFAHLIRMPQIYIHWAGLTLAIYQSLVYHRGKLGKIFKRLGLN